VRTNGKVILLLSAILGALILNLCAMGGVMFLQVRGRKTASSKGDPAGAPAATGAGSSEAATTADGHPHATAAKMEWHEPPLIASVGGDDNEDIIGQVSTVGDDGQMTYYVGAFDGTTFEQLWRSPSLAVLERGERPPIVRMVADHIIVAEANTIHVDDPTTGNETGAVRTTDRIVDLCAYGPDKTRVWAKVADGRSVSFDPQTAEPKPTETAPQGCAPGAKSAKADAPSVPGFSPNKVLVEGDAAVALGVKSPGSPVPMASGFDPKSRKVRWTHAIPPTDDVLNVVTTSGRIAELWGGELFATYRLSSAGWQLTALDAKTGDRTWDTAVPDGNAGVGTITVSPSRVYLAHATWLDVFDKASGRRIGSIGDHAK
jgi:outer membrane protein assembly factor BamB